MWRCCKYGKLSHGNGSKTLALHTHRNCGCKYNNIVRHTIRRRHTCTHRTNEFSLFFFSVDLGFISFCYLHNNNSNKSGRSGNQPHTWKPYTNYRLACWHIHIWKVCFSSKQRYLLLKNHFACKPVSVFFGPFFFCCFR